MIHVFYLISSSIESYVPHGGGNFVEESAFNNRQLQTTLACPGQYLSHVADVEGMSVNMAFAHLGKYGTRSYGTTLRITSKRIKAFPLLRDLSRGDIFLDADNKTIYLIKQLSLMKIPCTDQQYSDLLEIVKEIPLATDSIRAKVIGLFHDALG